VKSDFETQIDIAVTWCVKQWKLAHNSATDLEALRFELARTCQSFLAGEQYKCIMAHQF
jgi:hypothetical protein